MNRGVDQFLRGSGFVRQSSLTCHAFLAGRSREGIVVFGDQRWNEQRRRSCRRKGIHSKIIHRGSSRRGVEQAAGASRRKNKHEVSGRVLSAWWMEVRLGGGSQSLRNHIFLSPHRYIIKRRRALCDTQFPILPGRSSDSCSRY